MNKDLILEVLKHDELISELKKSILNQIARDNTRKKLRAKRHKIRAQQEKYENKTRKAIDVIDNELYRLNHEEDSLCVIVDNEGDNIDSPHFTKEAVELLVAFMKKMENE